MVPYFSTTPRFLMRLQRYFPKLVLKKRNLETKVWHQFNTFTFLLILKIALWHKEEHRRKFFENYASENGFDPRRPENWHTQPKEKIMAYKVQLNFLKGIIIKR
jgi:hypothetical protein